MPRMYGTSVVLRELRWEDLPDVRAWMTDGATTDLLGDRFTRPQTWEQTESYLRELVEGNAGGVHFAIAEPEKLHYLGEIALTAIDRKGLLQDITRLISDEMALNMRAITLEASEPAPCRPAGAGQQRPGHPRLREGRLPPRGLPPPGGLPRRPLHRRAGDGHSPRGI